MSKWIHKWKRKDWKCVYGKPVKNRELWERLDAAAERHSVKFKWVRCHNGNPGNERAHSLSEAGAIKACGHAIDFKRIRRG